MALLETFLCIFRFTFDWLDQEPDERNQDAILTLKHLQFDIETRETQSSKRQRSIEELKVVTAILEENLCKIYEKHEIC